MMKVGDIDASDTSAKLTRREREVVEKERNERMQWAKKERGETVSFVLFPLATMQLSIHHMM